jgi:hypothetical protein
MPRRPTMIPSSMRIGFDDPMTIELKGQPTPSAANLLHVLGEFPNRFVPMYDLCDRLRSTELGVKILACRLRKYLTVDWTIQHIPRRGYRLIDLRDR